jgi:hypothetical protein
VGVGRKYPFLNFIVGVHEKDQEVVVGLIGVVQDVERCRREVY